MTQKIKILILTLDAGFGHRRAAVAISEACKTAFGEKIDCKIINPLKETGTSSLITKSQAHYNDTARNHRYFYRMVYGTTNQYPITLLADQVITPLLMHEIWDTIIKEHPDGIIVTFPFFYTAVRRTLDLLHLHIPLYSVVTDLHDVHQFWFQPGPDKYFVASEQLKHQAMLKGIRQEKIIISGIPVDIQITKDTREKSIIRQQLGWEPQMPTLLAIGSRRVHNLFDRLIGIEECNIPFQLCVVAGGDDELYQAVNTKKWKIPVKCYNYVNNIPELLHAADVLITKAGGLVVSEGLASGLPIIIIDSITGQETGNVDYLLAHHAAVVANTTEELKNTILFWLSDEQTVMKKYAQNAQQLGKPDAAYQIIHHIVNEIQINQFYVKNRIVWNRIQQFTNLLVTNN